MKISNVVNERSSGIGDLVGHRLGAAPGRLGEAW
jgi:hypothetical protein